MNPVIKGPGNWTPAAVAPANTALKIWEISVGEQFCLEVGSMNVRAIKAIRLNDCVCNIQIGGGTNGCICAHSDRERYDCPGWEHRNYVLKISPTCTVDFISFRWPGTVLDFIVSSSHPTVAFLSINFKGVNTTHFARRWSDDCTRSSRVEPFESDNLPRTSCDADKLVLRGTTFVRSPTWNLNRWKLKRFLHIDSPLPMHGLAIVFPHDDRPQDGGH